MNRKYEDIIHLPHPTSSRHPRMSSMARAAQFSPFAALTGYDDAVKETARPTEQKVTLDEYEKQHLDDCLQCIRERLSEAPEVEIIYFVPDERKDGGAYRTEVGSIKKIDSYKRVIIMKSGVLIPIDDIVNIEGSILSQLDDSLI